MISIYVGPHDIHITTDDGRTMCVKSSLVRKAGDYVTLFDWEPPSELSDIELIIVGMFYSKNCQLKTNVKEAILHFLQKYHAQENMSFDCYAFANLVKGIPEHKDAYMLEYWDRQKLPWFIPAGSVIFLESNGDLFHHAAIYIGHGLYISVYGAGGDLEFTTLKSMKRDFRAKTVSLATPRIPTAYPTG